MKRAKLISFLLTLLLLAILCVSSVISKPFLNEHLTNLYGFLDQINRKNQGNFNAFNTPAFVICGPQDVGKSFLLQLLLGFPMNIAKEHTATRAPLEFHLTHDPNFTTPSVLFDGEDINYRDLKKRVEKKTEYIANNKRFTDEPIIIKVRSAGVPNIVFIDTPGLIPAATDPNEASIVKEILKSVLRDKNRMVIAVSKVEDKMAHYIRSELRDIFTKTPGFERPNWEEETIFVSNYFEHNMELIQTGIQGNSFFNSRGSNEFFVNLFPKSLRTLYHKKRWDELNWDEQFSIIEKCNLEEQKEIDTFVKKMQDNNRENRANDIPIEDFQAKYMSNIGMLNVKKFISQLWKKKFFSSLPETTNQLERLAISIKKTLESNRNLMKSPEHIKELLSQFLLAWNELKNQFFASKLSEIRDIERHIGKTFHDEEELFFKNPVFGGVRNPCTNAELVTNEEMSYLPGRTHLLVGDAQFKRLAYDFLRVCAVNLTPSNADLSLIHNKAVDLSRGHFHMDWDKAITELVKEEIHMSLTPVMEYMVKRGTFIAQMHVNVWDELVVKRPEFSELKPYSKFFQKVRSTFVDYAVEVMENSLKLAETLVRIHSESVDWNIAFEVTHVYPKVIPRKIIQFSKQESLISKNAETDDQQLKFHFKEEAESQNSNKNSSDDVLEDFGSEDYLPNKNTINSLYLQPFPKKIPEHSPSEATHSYFEKVVKPLVISLFKSKQLISVPFFASFLKNQIQQQFIYSLRLNRKMQGILPKDNTEMLNLLGFNADKIKKEIEIEEEKEQLMKDALKTINEINNAANDNEVEVDLRAFANTK